jgi:hypothetical protein
VITSKSYLISHSSKCFCSRITKVAPVTSRELGGGGSLHVPFHQQKCQELLLSHANTRLSIKIWPHFFTRTSTSSVHQLNHPTRNLPSKPPRTLITRLHNGVRIIDSGPVLAISLAASIILNGPSRDPGITEHHIIRDSVTDTHPVSSTLRTPFPRTSDSTRTLTRTTPVFGRLYDRIGHLAILIFWLTDLTGPSQPLPYDPLPLPSLGYPRW